MLKNGKIGIFDIAKKNNFKRFVHFQVTLRDKINYDIELINGYVNFTSDEKNHPLRHVVFACQTYFRMNQKIPPKYNAFFLSYNPGIDSYNYETSVIDILLECSDSDFKKMSIVIGEKKIQIYLYELLEYFSYKYNLAVSGNDFINISELCVGSFKCMFYFRNKKTGEYENSNGRIYPALSIIECSKKSKLNFQRVVNTDIPAWHYFVNKTKYCYAVYNNIDSVLNASIAIEAYIIFLIRQNNKYDEYINTYTNQLGFKSALNFCVDNKIIGNELKELFKSGYEKIGKYRSLIIHGAIESPIVDREQARRAYEVVVDIFSSLNEDLYEEKGLLIPDSYFENDYNMMISIQKDYENGNFELAIKKLNYNIENDCFKDLSIFNRGRCYISLKKTKEAINDFKICIENRYRMIESYNYLGIELSKLDKHQEAKRAYIKGIELDNTYSEYFYNLGIEHQLLKEYDDAIKNYNEALSIKKYACYYYNLGTVYYYKNDFSNSLLNYNEAIKLDPCNSKYLYERAFLYEILKVPTKAEKDIIGCIKNYKNEPRIEYVIDRIYQIGVLYQQDGRFKDAIRMFNKGIKIDDLRVVFYQARGNCYRSMGIVKKARKDYVKALNISPNSVINITNLVYSYLDSNELENAYEYVNILIKKHKTNLVAIDCIDLFEFQKYQNDVISYKIFLDNFKKRHNDVKSSTLYSKILEIMGEDKTKKFLKL